MSRPSLSGKSGLPSAPGHSVATPSASRKSCQGGVPAAEWVVALVSATSDTGVREQTCPLRGPWPCHPASENALQPLSLCSKISSSKGYSSPEKRLFCQPRATFGALAMFLVRSSSFCPRAPSLPPLRLCFSNAVLCLLLVEFWKHLYPNMVV